MRVILVAYHYPPDPAVGSLRARNVARALAAAGHEVHVVTIALPDVAADARDGAVNVVRVTQTTTPRELVGRLVNFVRALRRNGRRLAEMSSSPQIPGAGWKGPAQSSTLRRWLDAVTWLPDDRQGFILPAVRAAEALMRGDGDDMLYTTAPPFTDHVVGLMLRVRRRFRWILEFRDPWTGETYKPWFIRAQLTDSVEQWLEAQCIRRCDGIVTVASAYTDVLERRYGTLATDKMVLVRNGIPRMSVADPSFGPSADPSMFRIVHAGSFYLHRDPKPFFTALAALRRRGALQRRLDVRLVGDCRVFDGEPLAPLIERLGLSDVVTFADWLPHAETVALLASADLLLLLAQNQPLSVPNKLYEYLGMGKPIFAITDVAGETARLLREVGGHFVLDGSGSPEAMERVLVEALALPLGRRDDTPALAALATDAQMRTLTDWLERTRQS